MKKYLLCFFLLMTVILKGNEHRLIACDHSMEAIQWAKTFIEQAEYSIELSPCLTGGELLDELLDLVEVQMRKKPKLKVKALLCTTFLEPQNIQHINRLKTQFSRQFHLVYSTHVLNLCRDLSFIDNHIKMIIVDEWYYVTGGTNYDYVIASEGTIPVPRREKPIMIGSQLPNGARDQDVAGRGAMAKELRQTFYKMLALWEEYQLSKKLKEKNLDGYAHDSQYRELPPHATPFIAEFEEAEEGVDLPMEALQLVIGGPAPTPNPITEAYCRLIDGAKEEILIANLYFSPTQPLLEALMRAAKRGVKLTVITNGVNDRAPDYTKLWSCANRVCYVPVLYGKTYGLFDKKKCEKDPLCPTKIYEFYVDEMLFHKKVMIVDQEKVVIGSYNLGLRSDLSDYEMILISDSKEFAKRALTVFKKDLAHSIELTPKQMRDWYFDPMSSYLAELQRRLHPLL